MATMITDECINCGACEPECPNTAIYQGGVEYDWQGAKHAALSNEIFYIVPEKCTECVGFYDHEACAAVCPVDCCIPNPNIPESEAVLLARAAEIHPDKTFGPDSPSRFKGDGAAAAPAPAAAPAVA
ncbi:YfhL family 4Fe-4S dicluster ferredoxin, partial [Candidatus Binatia bacterium]|nr:YfhL family 4Fe-4S dicluster ferredoxin [Candidatus Binatia bacterium]